jgi:hypothetical protein
MQTTINGQPAAWPATITGLWHTRVVPHLDPERPAPDTANFFEPRPWVDEYNRGSRMTGFVYTVGRDVYVTDWSVDPEG